MIATGSFLAALLLTTSAVQAQWDPSRHAYYSSGAANFQGALPIGNGRMAAVVYGTNVEKLSINENSVWSGTWLNRTSTRSAGALQGIRNQLKNGDLTAAGQAVLDNMSGNPTSPRQYHPTIDLLLDFGHSGTLQQYTRVLDTYLGTVNVTYNYQNVKYRYGRAGDRVVPLNPPFPSFVFLFSFSFLGAFFS